MLLVLHFLSWSCLDISSEISKLINTHNAHRFLVQGRLGFRNSIKVVVRTNHGLIHDSHVSRSWLMDSNA